MTGEDSRLSLPSRRNGLLPVTAQLLTKLCTLDIAGLWIVPDAVRALSKAPCLDVLEIAGLSCWSSPGGARRNGDLALTQPFANLRSLIAEAQRNRSSAATGVHPFAKVRSLTSHGGLMANALVALFLIDFSTSDSLDCLILINDANLVPLSSTAQSIRHYSQHLAFHDAFLPCKILPNRLLPLHACQDLESLISRSADCAQISATTALRSSYCIFRDCGYCVSESPSRTQSVA